jgi:hypothetical protein
LAPAIISGHLRISKAHSGFQSAFMLSKCFHIFIALSYFHGAFIAFLSKALLFPFKALLFIFSSVSQRAI